MVESFPVTNWECIQALKKEGQQEKSKDIIAHLSSSYWKPVHSFLLQKGFCEDLANDLCQDFFCEVVLKNELFHKADEAKGRLRTYLLKCLNNFVSSYLRKQKTLKNSPNYCTSSRLIENESVLTCKNASPDQAYNIAWVREIINEVISKTENYCICQDKTDHWKVFEELYLLPIIYSEDKPSLSSLCIKYRIKDAKTISNMAITVKRIFCRFFYNKLNLTVVDKHCIEKELYELFHFF